MSRIYFKGTVSVFLRGPHCNLIYDGTLKTVVFSSSIEICEFSKPCIQQQIPVFVAYNLNTGTHTGNLQLNASGVRSVLEEHTQGVQGYRCKLLPDVETFDTSSFDF